MSELIRFGISMEEKLLDSFDQLIQRKGYQTRSEAIRDLIRASLIDDRMEHPDSPVVATVTLVYNHHVTDLADKLTDHQHANGERIVSSLHVHLDAHNCLEVLILKGKAAEVKRIADELIGVKGVRHGKLVMTTTDEHYHGNGKARPVH